MNFGPGEQAVAPHEVAGPRRADADDASRRGRPGAPAGRYAGGAGVPRATSGPRRPDEAVEESDPALGGNVAGLQAQHPVPARRPSRPPTRASTPRPHSTSFAPVASATVSIAAFGSRHHDHRIAHEPRRDAGHQRAERIGEASTRSGSLAGSRRSEPKSCARIPHFCVAQSHLAARNAPQAGRNAERRAFCPKYRNVPTLVRDMFSSDPFG